MTPHKVPVTVISGFLGSGKTTLLRRLVSDPSLPHKLAVIVNDLGELGLDHELIAAESDTPTLRVTELTSGCVCCTLKSELGEALLSLARGEGLDRPPAHILIEPSGIAKASEVSFAIGALSFDGPVECDAVVTVVDLHNAERAHREHPELFEDQVRFADLLLLNKVDLEPDLVTQQRLAAWLQALAPRAQQIFTCQAEVDARLLLGQLDLLAQSPSRQPPPAPHPPTHAHRPEAHGIAARTLPVPFAIDWPALEDLLDSLADHIFRIKGIVDRQDESATTPLLVQAVGDRIDWQELPPDSPLTQAPRRLIFIGEPQALDEPTLWQALQNVAATPKPRLLPNQPVEK